MLLPLNDFLAHADNLQQPDHLYCWDYRGRFNNVDKL